MNAQEIAQLAVGEHKDFGAVRDAILAHDPYQHAGISAALRTIDILSELDRAGVGNGPARKRLRRILEGDSE